MTFPLASPAVLSWLLLASAPARPAEPPVAAPGVVVARAHGRGAPSLMWTPRSAAPSAARSAEAAARSQLLDHAAAYGITAEVVAGARTLYVHDTGRGGIIVALRPTVADVDVVRGDVKLLLDRSHRLLAISGSPHPLAHPGGAAAFDITPEAAVLAALRDLHPDVLVDALRERAEADGWRRYDLVASRDLQFREPARVRPVYLPDGDALLPAYLLELQTRLRGREEVRQFVVAADGRVHLRHDAREYAHQYRVYASPEDGRPLDGPLSDFNPHPTKDPEDVPEGLAETTLRTVEGMNTNLHGQPDPWLAPDATETRGNNADVFLDRLDQSQQSQQRRGLVSAPGVFDHTYDVAEPAVADDEQYLASATQAFYVANWLHDWWYDSGFVEATGAAQQSNYGRGGEAGDPLVIQTQNGALRNLRDNAYITVPLDGSSPRMELFVFGPPDEFIDLSAQPLDQSFQAWMVEFGQRTYDLTAPLVVVDDGAGPSPTDACEPPAHDLGGKIVLVDRGGCSERSKVERVQAAGAVGVLLANDADNTHFPIITGTPDHVLDITIPSLGINHLTAEALRTALDGGAQEVHMQADAAHTLDSALEGLTLQHEFGHLIHRRLTDCWSDMCSAMSEGWGDFLAQLMSARAGDDLHGVFTSKNYVVIDATQYFGFRRAPYSTDMAYNALTFRHISDSAALPDTHPLDPSLNPNSGAHNAGEIWVEMMWESYAALHELHADDLEFEEVRRRMSDYVVGGMMFAPVDATYTEQRDALLMVAAAHDPADGTAIAEGFARRGAGSCAVAPPRYSLDFEGVVEDFSARGRGELLAAVLDDGERSCDDDGVVDVGELGRLELVVYNAGHAPLTVGTTVELLDPPPGLVFEGDPVFAVPQLAPQEQDILTIPVTVDPELAGPAPVALRLRLTTPDSCNESVERTVHAYVHADLAPTGATIDDVEAGPGFTPAGEDADRVWSRLLTEDGHVWRGADLAIATDTALTSPPLHVAEDTGFTLSFDHAYWFDAADGGVIELSEDDGATWYDILEIGEPGYTSTIHADDSALADRRVFGGLSPDYPALKTLSLPFGKKFAGKTLRVRFRSATGHGSGAGGWSLDNLRVEGVTNAPFSQWTENASACPDHEEPTTSGSAGDSGGETDSGDAAPDSAGGQPGADADAGCGCSSDSPGSGWPGPALALALFALHRRRRSTRA